MKFSKTWTGQGFALGVFFGFMVLAIYQDFLGKEAYIERVSEVWYEMHWAWWLIPFVIGAWYLRVLFKVELKARGLNK